MRFAIIVEGDRDAEAYRAFIRKIRQDVEDIPAEQCGGVGKLRTTFVGFLKRLQSNRARPVHKVMVIRDSDCHDPERSERRLEEILEQSRFEPNFPAHFYATKCMLETLLLADENGINTVERLRQRDRVIEALNLNFEAVEDAKALFRQRLKMADLPDDPKVYGEVADASDLQVIAQRCPYFRKFVERVHAC